MNMLEAIHARVCGDAQGGIGYEPPDRPNVRPQAYAQSHALCASIPEEMKTDYVQPGVGHYGVFNGTRWRTEIQPRVREMIRTTAFKRRTQAKPAKIIRRVDAAD